jgi:diguanylate cyclase (GGDEF)-like protein
VATITDREILDSLEAQIAVLDARGVIEAVNESWRRFARENGGPEDSWLGTNYLEVCERAAERDPEGTARAVLDGLRMLVDGRLDAFSLEYPCHSPDEQRWYALRATRCAGPERAFVVSHEDVSRRRRSEGALRETESMLRKVLETLPVGVWIMDRSGRIRHGNPAGVSIWAGARYVGPEQFGEYKGWWLGTGKPIAAEEWAAARAIRNGEVSLDEEIEIECFDGTHKIILNSAMPLLGENGEVTGAIIVNQDITHRKEIEEALGRALDRQRELARTDDLTGAFNRRHFRELAVHEVAVAKRYHHPLAVILFDLDHFKRINDIAGHDAGDEALRRVARLVTGHLREADLFARYGGEEFILLLPGTTAPEAVLVAERIRTAIAAEGVMADHGFTAMTISSGVAELLPGDDSLELMIRRADDALYRAKNAGRNRTMLAEAPAV